MKRLRVVLYVGAVVAMVMAAYAFPAMAQTPEEVQEAKRLIATAERMGIEVPSDPNERVALAAKYGVTITPEAAAAADQPGKAKSKTKSATTDKDANKELPKSGGGMNVGMLLALGAGVALIGGGLVAHRSHARRRRG